ncbi:MAG: AAA family ATPase [Anaerolineae bacterium UTCFX2]|jgi:MoxR-like ATPase|nr:AAA family ATPase [Anaerolineae bacterium]MCZ7553888.1 AAA family ATPase [Anaerolineales bacterium]OQY90854.1 MAG: AAA family ATPase [Anaerolineae bacterium UTCFX2]
MTEYNQVLNQVSQFRDAANTILNEMRKVIVGQETLIHDMLVTLLGGGNALMEGVPGLGKTLLIRTLAQALDCSFSRIQFTPDLMPADITGTMIITEAPDGRRGFRFERGPVFANLILADEINRATPRTQSALLEAMQEQHVTVAGESYHLPKPFFVLATQNPIELEGTFPLPEAQLDRFFYKLDVPSPMEDELVEIARRTTGSSSPVVEVAADVPLLLSMQTLVRQVPVEERVYRYAARVVSTTQPDSPDAPARIRQYLRVGISPRGIQAMIIAAKVEALLDNRKAVAIDDIRRVALPALRHRLFLNFEALSEGISPDDLVNEVLDAVQVPR